MRDRTFWAPRRPRWNTVAVLAAAIAVLAFLTVAIPGPARPAWFYGALALAGSSFVGVGLVPWARVPIWSRLVVLLGPVGAVGMLVYSAGSISGLSALFMLPVLITAMVGGALDSAIAVLATSALLAVVNIADALDRVVLIRSSIFWFVMLAIVSLAVRSLRRGLEISAARAREEANQSAIAADAARVLTTVHDPAVVTQMACALTARLASPTGTGTPAMYVAVVDHVAKVVATSGQAAVTALGSRFPLDEHEVLRRVVASGLEINARIDRDACGPRVRAALEQNGVTHGGYVPVRVSGRLHGVLVVGGRGTAIPDGLFERVRTLGLLTGMALDLAMAHEKLVEEAGTDPLTGISNRREFVRALQRRVGRLPFAILAIDIDSLKQANDRYGHAAGDALIQSVAGAIGELVRKGDVFARVGGDEFVVLAHGATPDGAEGLARRIRKAVQARTLPSGMPSVSIGVCHTEHADANGESIWHQADAALYAAKRRGGATIELAPDESVREETPQIVVVAPGPDGHHIASAL